MSKTLWYITKYFRPKTSTSPGGRGWMLMKELASFGYSAVVITSDSERKFDPPDFSSSVYVEDVDGVKLVWLKTMKYSVAKSTRRMLSWLHFEWNVFRLEKSNLRRPDVIIVSSLSLLTIVNGIILKRKYNCRLAFEVRDIWPLTLTEEGGFSTRNPFIMLLSIIERWGYARSDVIIGTMPNLVEHVSNVAAAKAPVVCVPMGINQDQIDDIIPIDSAYIEKYLSSNKFKVVHAGTVGITNALEVFFEAAIQLQNYDNIEFIIVGDGPLREYFVNKYSSLPNIVFAPKVTKRQVQSVLSYCDAVYFSVFPSKVWDYGQSLNKVIDYMLSGKPIIASYSGYKSMINESGCGTFVPAGDASALAEEVVNLSMIPKNARDAIGARGKAWLIENRSYSLLARKFAGAVFSQ